jgi:hypothetical protein
MYAADEDTTEFGVRMRAEMGVGDEGQGNGDHLEDDPYLDGDT